MHHNSPGIQSNGIQNAADTKGSAPKTQGTEWNYNSVFTHVSALEFQESPWSKQTDHNTTQPATPPIKTAEAGQVIEKV